MTDSSLSSFTSPSDHAAVADLIRRRSSNPADVRELALADLDLRCVRDVLDLGCGFGFLTGKILERLAPGARVLGLDACEENRAPFLRTVSLTGRPGEFQCARLEHVLPCPDHTYDLVVASYALYFFIGVLPEIPRVLRRDGVFLAITHSEATWRALYRVAGVDERQCPLFALVRNFSAENGASLLNRHFGRIETVVYPNDLRFEPRHLDELLHYVRFKLPWLLPEGCPCGELPDELRQRLTRALSAERSFVMEKDDAIFRCRDPRQP
jgi:SAM-dependent methyltransferase